MPDQIAYHDDMDATPIPPTDLTQDDDQTPGVTRWLISCDESGTGGSPFYGFGSLWMRWQRRGDFAAAIRELRERHRFDFECKWTKVSPRYLPFFKDLVLLFFSKDWLVFHCLIVRTCDVKKDLHGGDFDLARRKHFTMLLTNKIRRCLNTRPAANQTFRIFVDPIASRYKKADEAVEVISNNVLARAIGSIRPVDKVITRDSKDTPSIQLCDLLLGACMEAWQQKSQNPCKAELQTWIAHHLGWDDLRADTPVPERKMNIWCFKDQVRWAKTRSVKLLYPLK